MNTTTNPTKTYEYEENTHNEKEVLCIQETRLPNNTNDIENKALYECVKELQYQMQSLINMNENVNLKLSDLSLTEAKQRQINKDLVEQNKNLKLENDKLLDVVQELKASNEDLVLKMTEINNKLEILDDDKLQLTENIQIKEEIRETYIKIKFNNENDKLNFETTYLTNSDKYNLIEINDEYKIINFNWFNRNINTLVKYCSLIIFHNLDTYEVVDDIIISNNIIFNATPTTNINFINNSTIIINNFANVVFNNIGIVQCRYEDNYLINIEDECTLDFNKGNINNNSGNKSIFNIKRDATLSLLKTSFENNIQLSFDFPSCIRCETDGNLIINECEFLNHHSKSARLIESRGNLSIISSKFENNIGIPTENTSSIIAINGIEKIVNIDDIKYENCSPMKFETCSNLMIKNSSFLNNNAFNQFGGCLHIERCINTLIQNSEFKMNHSNKSAGAIYFYNNIRDCTIEKCLFEENSSGVGWRGGGAIASARTTMTILNSIFYKNSSEIKGGAISHSDKELICGSCKFMCNKAREHGGAVSLDDKHKFNEPSLNIFDSNKAKDILNNLYYYGI